MKKLYEETNIQNIANAIRQKGVSGTFKTSEMPQAIMNISGGGGDIHLEEKTITKNGTYTPSFGYDGFSKVTANIPSMVINNSPYTDENGKFVKPAEWDDIESIQLSDTDDVLYYLYDNTLEFSYCSIRVYVNSGNSICDFGRIRNGVFEVLDTQTKNTGGYYQRCLTDDFPNEDYIVLRIRPADGKYLTKADLASWTYNGRAIGIPSQPVLMRYGNMPSGQTISIAGEYLVSDNVMNCGNLTSLSGVYSNCIRLVRHRHTGWNASNVASVASMFNYCYCLSDCDTDFSGWCTTGKLTTMSAFMYYCYSIKGDINLTGWNTENCLNISNCFNGCFAVTKMIGIEDWKFPICTTNTSCFNGCSSLYQNEQGKLDLSNWECGKDVTVNSSVSNMFANCRLLKEIDVSTWNMNAVTNLGTFMANCYLLEKITLPNNIGIDGNLTTMTSTFANCSRLKEIDLSKIDFSKVTTMNSMLNNDYCLETVIPPTTTPLGGSATNILTTLINNAYSIETLDMSWLDCSKFTNASSQFNDMFKNCIKLRNLIPPININNTFRVDYCFNLSRESLVAILNNLSQLTTAKTVTLGTVNLAKLTADDIAIATGKGWTVA